MSAALFSEEKHKRDENMNIAVVLAGGTGQRFGATVPKQFVRVFGKPLIVYSLEIYQRTSMIDAIEVVSIPAYIEDIWRYADEYGISKLKWVVPGGDCCQESIRCGITALEGICAPDDILMYCMSTSVFVDEEIIQDSLKTCKKYGNAFAAMQCIYNLATTYDGLTCTSLNRKEVHKTLNLPWTAPYGTFQRLYRIAYEENIETDAAAYAPTLFLAMGETLYLSKDTPKNKLHVTTRDDLEIIKGCLLLAKYEERKQ